MKIEDTPHKLLSMIMYCFPSPCCTVQVAHKSEQFVYFWCPFLSGWVWTAVPPPKPFLPWCVRIAALCAKARKSGLASPFVSSPRPPSFGERCPARLRVGQHPRCQVRLGEGTEVWDDAIPDSESQLVGTAAMQGGFLCHAQASAG